jgi:hypothetical protein
VRKTIYAVSVLAVLLVPVLPAWGELPSAPAIHPAEMCPASAVALPELLPQPLFETGTCGVCSDPVCVGLSPDAACTSPEGPGRCSGLIVGSVVQLCSQDNLYKCRCFPFDA